MRCVVHGPQTIDRDVRINLSGILTRMTKQRLQRADIRSILQHQRSGRVTKHVTRTWLLDTRRIQIPTHQDR
jgi:hypothetical protein